MTCRWLRQDPRLSRGEAKNAERTPTWELLDQRPLVLKDVRPSSQTLVTMLGLEKPLPGAPAEGRLPGEVPALSVDQALRIRVYAESDTRRGVKP